MSVLTKQSLARQLTCCPQFRYLSQVKAVDLIETLTDLIVCHLLESSENIVALRGFGSFRVIKRRAYSGSHPQTGNPMEYGSRRTMHFRPSAEVTRRLNSIKNL